MLLCYLNSSKCRRGLQEEGGRKDGNRIQYPNLIHYFTHNLLSLRFHRWVSEGPSNPAHRSHIPASTASLHPGTISIRCQPLRWSLGSVARNPSSLTPPATQQDDLHPIPAQLLSSWRIGQHSGSSLALSPSLLKHLYHQCNFLPRCSRVISKGVNYTPQTPPRPPKFQQSFGVIINWALFNQTFLFWQFFSQADIILIWPFGLKGH